jgi:hypothetical protein
MLVYTEISSVFEEGELGNSPPPPGTFFHCFVEAVIIS